MKIECLGVGEAFDPEIGNSSYIVHSDTKLLIDCGYAVPRSFFAKEYAPDFVDAIYLSHFHADHTFGLPVVLFRLFEEGRKKPLKIIGQMGTSEKVRRLIEFAYPTLLEKINYSLEFIDTVDPVILNELQLSFALSEHTISNYAIKVEKEGLRIGFSGDGKMTAASKALFENCKILVHEAYKFEEEKFGHESARIVAEYAEKCPAIKHLVFVHIQREERRRRKEDFLSLSNHFAISVPRPGDMI